MKQLIKMLAVSLAFLMCISLIPFRLNAEDEGGETTQVVEVQEQAEEKEKEEAKTESKADKTEPEKTDEQINEEINSDLSGQCGDDLYWSLDVSTKTLTITGSGDMWNWSLLSDYYNPSPWYSLSRSVITVVLPEGLTNIGDFAFSECLYLQNAAIPDSVRNIGTHSFYECISLKNVDISSNVTFIGDYAFCACEELMAINVAEDNMFYSSVDGVLYDKEQTVLIQCPPGKTGELVIPETVTRIGASALVYCGSLTGVKMPEGLASIGSFAFKYCVSLVNAEIPTTVTDIGEEAFSNCWELKDITIPKGITSIGRCTFDSCFRLESINIPADVTSIGPFAFSQCRDITEIRFDGAPPQISNNAFENVTANAYYPANERSSWLMDGVLQNYGGNLTWIEEGAAQCGDYLTWDLKNSVLTISGAGDMWDWERNQSPWHLFRMEIVSVILPEGLTSIGDHAFDDCQFLTDINIPEGVTDIGSFAFFSCYNLADVNLPESLTEIGEMAFRHCFKLKSISIPAGVCDIRAQAFANCSNLGTIIFQGKAPVIEWGAFSAVTATAYYPMDDTWTDEIRQDYGGNITWQGYNPDNPFEDVKLGKYYYDAVLWAYYHDPQITGGVNQTHFGPNKECTREQIVTFLWKAEGAPEPVTDVNPFTDVKENKYYYKAVLWAYENGITSGVSTDKFGVKTPCTREQIVTFLWNAVGRPEPVSDSNPFTDVKVNKYYYKAVLWAVENGITSGVSPDTFGVGQTCTRAQAVTFLYKCFGGK